ncbi:unnamed protein product, partial [Aphanomyces euteiches]
NQPPTQLEHKHKVEKHPHLMVNGDYTEWGTGMDAETVGYGLVIRIVGTAYVHWFGVLDGPNDKYALG